MKSEYREGPEALKKFQRFATASSSDVGTCYLKFATTPSCISAIGDPRMNAASTEDFFHGCYGFKHLLLYLKVMRGGHACRPGSHARNHSFVFIQAQVELDLPQQNCNQFPNTTVSPLRRCVVLGEL